MSKDFRRWKIDEAQLLPPSVQDYVPKDPPVSLIVALVREELDLSAISGSYTAGLVSPRSIRDEDGACSAWLCKWPLFLGAGPPKPTVEAGGTS